MRVLDVSYILMERIHVESPEFYSVLFIGLKPTWETDEVETNA